MFQSLRISQYLLMYMSGLALSPMKFVQGNIGA